MQLGLTRSPKLLDQYRTPDLLPITVEKLDNPGRVLTLEESITVISNCLDIGEERAKAASGKEIIIFLGNTGAGKSTTVNYLAGCKLEKIKKAAIGIKGSGVIVRVKADSAIPEMMPIGHEKTSKTFLPDIQSDSTFTYCDCPGFLDTRGSEINIANAVNIRTAIQQAKGLKVLTLINYHSLQAEKGRGLQETQKILTGLFGNEERLEANIASVILGVTQAMAFG